LHITSGASTLELPVRPTDAGETPSFELFADRYAVSGAQPAPYRCPLEGVEIAGEIGKRTYTLIGGGGSLAPGSKKVHGVDTVIRETYHLRRSIREDDPNTAEMETEAVNAFERGDWQATVRSRCLCRSTPTHFLCSETLEAAEGDRVFFTRTWYKEIARQLV
jgi:hypothetical protein